MKFVEEQSSERAQWLLVDTSNLAYRAAFGMRHMRTPKGKPNGHIFGAASMLADAIETLQPERIAFAFDCRAGALWRRALLDKHLPEDERLTRGYKRNREKSEQVDLAPDLVTDVEQLFSLLPGVVLRAEGYEADDVLAAFSTDRAKLKQRTLIWSADRDMLQLCDEFVHVLHRLGEQPIDAQLFRRKHGYRPRTLTRVKALRGDPSDNIAGMQGDRRAGKLVRLVDMAKKPGGFFSAKCTDAEIEWPSTIDRKMQVFLLDQRDRLRTNLKAIDLRVPVKRLAKQQVQYQWPASGDKQRFMAKLAEWSCSSTLGRRFDQLFDLVPKRGNARSSNNV